MNKDVIERGVQDLKTDFTNGSRVLATHAVQCLRDALPDTEPTSDINVTEFRNEMLKAGHQLATARPSMGAPIISAVLAAIDAVWADWQESTNTSSSSSSTQPSMHAEIRRAATVLDEQIARRRHTTERLADNFANWLCALPAKPDRKLNVLTLSSSSTLHECLVKATASLHAPSTAEASPRGNTALEVRILESRPACEGADFAAKLLLSSSSSSNLRITLAPDSHVCLLAARNDLDAVLLGADRISHAGDVSNKTGSLAVALCAKALSPRAKVVVVSESDKVARPGAMAEHADESGGPDEVLAAWKAETVGTVREALASEGQALSVRNVYFEWVPARYVDVYLMETGRVSREEIQEISRRKGELEERYLGQFSQ